MDYEDEPEEDDSWIEQETSSLGVDFVSLSWNKDAKDWDIDSNLGIDELAECLASVLCRMATKKIDWERGLG